MPLTELKAVGGIFILYDSCLWRPAGRSKHFFTRKAPSKQCILTVNAMDHRGPSCEKRSPENPQILRASFITNNFSAKNSHSARGGYSQSFSCIQVKTKAASTVERRIKRCWLRYENSRTLRWIRRDLVVCPPPGLLPGMGRGTVF